MKVYIHKKLGWKAVESNTEETSNYKIYKSEDSKSYTLRSSLEIEDSDDWKEVAKKDYEYIRLSDIADVRLELMNKVEKNGHTFNEEWENGYDKEVKPFHTVKTIIGGEEYGCISCTPLLDFRKDLMQHYQSLIKDYNKYHSNIPTKEEQKSEGSGFSAGEFTVLAYEWGGDTWASIGDTVYGVQIDGKVFNHRMDAPPADFKDRKMLKVRRESDGEIFSVGDTVAITGFSCSGETIERIYIDSALGGRLIFEVKCGETYFYRYIQHIKKAYKVEDGYVCEGDPIHMRSPSYYGANIWATGNFVKELLIFTAQPYGAKIYKTPIFNT